jgi:tetratricopeptide (TPR) repeat protein
MREATRPIFVLVLLLSGCGGEGGPPPNPKSASPFHLADSLRDEGRFLKAHPLYRRLRDSIALAGDSADLWRAQTWWAYTLIRTNRTDSASTALQLAMELADGRPERESWTRWVRCSRFSRIGQSDSAIADCTNALRVAENTGDHGLQARVHHQLGTIHSRLGHYRAAVDETERTLALHRRYHHPRRQMIGTFNSMGIEYVAVGRRPDV